MAGCGWPLARKSTFPAPCCTSLLGPVSTASAWPHFNLSKSPVAEKGRSGEGEAEGENRGQGRQEAEEEARRRWAPGPRSLPFITEPTAHTTSSPQIRDVLFFSLPSTLFSYAPRHIDHTPTHRPRSSHPALALGCTLPHLPCTLHGHCHPYLGVVYRQCHVVFTTPG